MRGPGISTDRTDSRTGGEPTGEVLPAGGIWTVLSGSAVPPLDVWLRQPDGKRHTWTDDADFWNWFERMDGILTACPSRFPNGVEPLVVGTPAGCVVFVLDGGGSWGTGAEAAAWFRRWIEPRIRDSDPSVDSITAMLAAGIQALPPEITADDSGWSFSLTVAIRRDDTVQVGSSGAIAAVIVRAEGVERLFVPARLVDALVSQGTISADEAETHSYRRIICSRWFGDGGGSSQELQWSPCVPFGEADRFVLGDAAMPRFLEKHALASGTAAELRDAVEGFGGSSAPTVIMTR